MLLREEYTLGVGKYGAGKGDEVKGAQRELHIKEFHHLYCSPNVIGMIMARLEERRDAIGIIWVKSAGRVELGRPRHRCNDNI